MCNKFLNKTNFCDHCKERFKYCKNTKHVYNHYPIKITLLLSNNITAFDKDKTDVDIILSLLHSSEKIYSQRMKDFVKFLDLKLDYIFDAIKKHWWCINDQNFSIFAIYKDCFSIYNNIEFAKDSGGKIMHFKEWLKYRYPKYL